MPAQATIYQKLFWVIFYLSKPPREMALFSSSYFKYELIQSLKLAFIFLHWERAIQQV